MTLIQHASRLAHTLSTDLSLHAQRVKSGTLPLFFFLLGMIICALFSALWRMQPFGLTS